MTGCGQNLSKLRQAFRDLALLHHPDKGLESCNETQLAWDVLWATFEMQYVEGLQTHESLGWFKGNITGKPHI